MPPGSTRTETVSARIGGSGASVGLAVAVNALGCDVTNVAGAAFDAPIGAGLGLTEAPLKAVAVIRGAAVDALGAVAVLAPSRPVFDATVANTTSGTARNPSALSVTGRNVSGVGAAGSFATSRISTGAEALVEDVPVFEAATLSVIAVDAREIAANARLTTSTVATTDGGASTTARELAARTDADYETDGVTVTDLADDTPAPTVSLAYGDLFRLADGYAVTGGAANSVYRFLSDARSEVDLAGEHFGNLDIWKEIPQTQLADDGFNLIPTEAAALGGVVVRNEVRTGASARVTANPAAAEDRPLFTLNGSGSGDERIGGDLRVEARQSASIFAEADSGVVSSGGTSIDGTGSALAVNGLIAFNTVRNGADALLEGVRTDHFRGGEVIVRTVNDGALTAETPTRS